MLLPGPAQGRDVLPAGLAAAGWEVDAVEAYRTVSVPMSGADRAVVAGADAVCFASGSSVKGFLEAGGGPVVLPPVVVCIGPTTAAAAVAAGLSVTAVAERHTLAGLVEALIGVLGPAGGT